MHINIGDDAKAEITDEGEIEISMYRNREYVRVGTLTMADLRKLYTICEAIKSTMNED